MFHSEHLFQLNGWQDLAEHSYLRGGSTITQQVAKNLFLTPEKTLRRKLREVVLAWRLERVLSKDRILEIYLNIAEWGNGVAGAEEASRLYFKKPAADLNWAEAAMLAGILPNPGRRDPFQDPDTAMRNRQAVLKQLLEGGQLDEVGFRQAAAEPLLARLREPMRIPTIRVGDGSARWKQFVHFAIQTCDGKDQPLPWTMKLAAAPPANSITPDGTFTAHLSGKATYQELGRCC